MGDDVVDVGALGRVAQVQADGGFNARFLARIVGENGGSADVVEAGGLLIAKCFAEQSGGGAVLGHDFASLRAGGEELLDRGAVGVVFGAIQFAKRVGGQSWIVEVRRH